ncbi:MAG: poly-gamma-glutamate system protein [Aminobacterium sp.]|jgi:poly-gamma-glutamate system protein|uniref:poly-gamma-glutamate system protein n=1 Tax=unclassified Aminobacterium TaxID=2685012 RepID=UPI001BCE4F83|nr:MULTISPECIES: poly-gamma-glutamate system protein [unclassified Aminobacterium]MDD2207724.1 poly-gamma-glutamate system protein [Aminobacterium sp.]MDD3708473.1 poly-gamma-glutamate system protein [Aminobacterium sp.]MDD4229180.1 poly-gamma-glutamate system protein [Aminobacterium sp.]MDD4552516.1 poly-gamma-glutamate system protein [Aminobacterium sp.]MEA4876980.1 poly-gamma-glutamate system protein [Aminobacterium sp.]
MKKLDVRFHILAFILLFVALQGFFKPGLHNKQIEAAEIMKNSLSVIKEKRLSMNIPIDHVLDPNMTGIIGEEFTPLTTTLGEVEDKRSSANPDFAAMMVTYLNQAGLKKGDIVCIGASGSFPALILATLSAAQALDLHPLVIYSIGASMYGANLPQFTFLDMLKEISKRGILPFSIVAVSMGGHNDLAEGMFFPEAQKEILEIAKRSRLYLISEQKMDESIKRRLSIYKEASKGETIQCFVNIGGASANFGDGDDSVSFPNGLVQDIPSLPNGPRKGLIFYFIDKGIPVIHLLNVKKLAQMNGIPYDPVPFPKIGTSQVFR